MPREKGVLFLVGIGPGDPGNMTNRCVAVLRNCDLVVGYNSYIELVAPFTAGKHVIASGMSREVERCSRAITAAAQGKRVALVSSGDPGVYGMAGLALEIVKKKNLWSKLDLEIVPGIPAIHAAAARLGAPLMNDYAVISLSDLLTPWEIIAQRVTHAALSDMVICIYNPKSTGRTRQIRETKSILLRHREAGTPVGLARNVGRQGESVVVTTLHKMLRYKIDMVTIIIIGNSSTIVENNHMITPRGYRL